MPRERSDTFSFSKTNTFYTLAALILPVTLQTKTHENRQEAEWIMQSCAVSCLPFTVSVLVLQESWERSCESHQVKSSVKFKGLSCFAALCSFLRLFLSNTYGLRNSAVAWHDMFILCRQQPRSTDHKTETHLYFFFFFFSFSSVGSLTIPRKNPTWSRPK